MRMVVVVVIMKQDVKVQIKLNWLRIWLNGGLFWTLWWTCRLHKNKEFLERSHDSSVSVVTRLWTGWLGFDFSLCHNVHTTSGSDVASYLMGTDHSPPSRAEVKTMWSYTSIPYPHGMVFTSASGTTYFTINFSRKILNHLVTGYIVFCQQIYIVLLLYKLFYLTLFELWHSGN
jgi:hypothetical protein